MKKLTLVFGLYMTLNFLFILTVNGQSSTYTKEMTPSIILSGLQMNVTNNINSNKLQILEGIRKAATDGAGFLVTPEGSLSGYTSNFNQHDLAVALKEVEKFAAGLKVGLMLGTCYKEAINGYDFCYNQVRIYSPEGHFMGAYSKILRCSNPDLP
jgi:predicted amidohydrolase